QQAREHTRIVSGNLCAARRVGVQRKVDQRSQRLALRRVEVKHAHCWINRASGLDDVGMLLARIPTDSAVTHPETPIETHSVCVSAARKSARRAELLMGFVDAARNQR